MHPSIRVTRFRFPVAAVQDYCQQSSGKLIGIRHEFGTRVIDTKDLQHGWTADLGVSHVAPKNLKNIAGLARTTTTPDLNVDSLPKVDVEVTTRLQNANRRYRSEVVADAQQPRWDPEPVVGSPGSSVPGTAVLW